MVVIPGMQIPVVASVGHGDTLLSAFDAALAGCGAHNYNVIPLSSVIPPGAEVVALDHYQPSGDEHGYRLYVVKAEIRSDLAGQVVGAGIGWYQWGDRRGVFVEHEAIGATCDLVSGALHERIRRSLRDLCTTRGVPFDPSQVRAKLVCAEVADLPTCALVLAIYQSEGWRQHHGVA